ncbi:hypothetical protein BKA57DRAFT_454045 [Linnemannia elongata]|nr:hypothetical protein BKA57DRAFT_454045 [Linnemannia elongata]
MPRHDSFFFVSFALSFVLLLFRFARSLWLFFLGFLKMKARRIYRSEIFFHGAPPFFRPLPIPPSPRTMPTCK